MRNWTRWRLVETADEMTRCPLRPRNSSVGHPMRMRSQRSCLETLPSRVPNLQTFKIWLSLGVERPLHGHFEDSLRESVSLLCHSVTLIAAYSHISTPIAITKLVAWRCSASVSLGARRA